MEKVRRGVEWITAPGAFFVRRTWASVVLLLLAGVIIGSGFYLQSQPDWTLRADIREYNQGVTEYHADPLEWKEPPYTAMERCGALWQKAAAITTDEKLKSLANYNYGTMMGWQAYASAFGGNTGLGIMMEATQLAEAIRLMAEAVRNDPDDEDAKFSLELLEKATAKQVAQQAGPGAGYNPGVVEKGY